MDNDTRLCARCGKAPRNSTLKSYCVECKRALGRESRERLGGKKPLTHCSRCSGLRDGRHPNYCKSCFKLWREERRVGPCVRCGKIRAADDRTNSDYCYDCWRSWWLNRKYGLTAAEYDAMLVQQGNCCAICKTEPNGRPWHVDHDHATGKVRGILCDNCNRGLGHFRDDIGFLSRAIEYLKEV